MRYTKLMLDEYCLIVWPHITHVEKKYISIYMWPHMWYTYTHVRKKSVSIYVATYAVRITRARKKIFLNMCPHISYT